MAILSNQGRTIPELPGLNASTIGTYDLLLIQNLESRSTKQTPVSEFVKKSAEILTLIDNLKFRGPNNQFTGSIRSVESDSYSIISNGVPNVLKRAIISDYCSIGYNLGATTTFDVYAKSITFDQGSGGGGNLTFLGNYSDSTFLINGYTGGIFIVNSDLTGENIIASTGFTGNLTGNVTGDVNSAGVSNFATLNTAIFNATLADITQVTINSGTINNTIIGDSIPVAITGTTITADTEFVGDLTGNVTGNLTGNVTATDITATTITSTDIIATNEFLGNLSGNVNGNVTSTGVSTFATLNATNLNATLADITQVTINSGTINNTVIGDSIPVAITGTTITADTEFVGDLTGNVTGNLTGNVDAVDITGVTVVADNIIANTGFDGDLTGNINYGGSYVLENTGPLTSFFYGSSSYAITASFASRVSSTTSATASYLQWTNLRSNGTASYSFNGIGEYSSFSSSYALSSSRSITSSYSKKSTSGSFATNSTLAKTSSYLLQTNQNTTNQVGYFNGTRLVSAPGLVFTNNSSGYKILSISSSQAFNYLSIGSRGVTTSGTKYNQAGITLTNYNSSESYPNYDGWTIMSATSGSLLFVAPIGSNAFSSSNILAKSISNECYGMIQRRNGFYFWPYMGSNTPSRDGAIGIGVQPPNESTGSFDKYLRAKLQINMFSGSGEGPWPTPATVEHRATAILVNYGSGSATTSLIPTFFVSASGNMFTRGNLRVNKGITGSLRGTPFSTFNGKSISFWGTGSHSVSSSFSTTSSFVTSGAGTFVNSVTNTSYADIPSSVGVDYTQVVLTVPVGKKIKHFKICGTVFNTLGCVFSLNGVKVNNTLVTNDVYSSLGWGTSVTMAPNTQLSFTIDGDPGIGNVGNVVFKLNWSTTRVGDTNMKVYIVGYY